MIHFAVEQVTTTSGGYQLLIESGILVSILGAIFTTGRWVGRLGHDVSEMRSSVTRLERATTDALHELGQRIGPLERDYERRQGYEQGKADERRNPGI